MSSFNSSAMASISARRNASCCCEKRMRYSALQPCCCGGLGLPFILRLFSGQCQVEEKCQLPAPGDSLSQISVSISCLFHRVDSPWGWSSCERHRHTLLGQRWPFLCVSPSTPAVRLSLF